VQEIAVILLGAPQAMQPYPHVRMCVAAKIQKKKTITWLVYSFDKEKRLV